MPSLHCVRPKRLSPALRASVTLRSGVPSWRLFLRLPLIAKLTAGDGSVLSAARPPLLFDTAWCNGASHGHRALHVVGESRFCALHFR
eukprot:6183542-Pleurochrysis_carterae.AAC.4